MLCALSWACADEQPPSHPCTDETDGRTVITADWLNRSLTVLHHQRLTNPECSFEQVLAGGVDLADHLPGPIELELAAGGDTAVVTVGPGFFTGAGGTLVGSPSIPSGGGLLVVDLAQRSVSQIIDIPEVPMGIAVHPNGRDVFTANFGDALTLGSTLAVVDLQQGAVVEVVDVGSGPEQVALSPDGALGAVNLASEGAVRFFRTSDVAESLTPAIATGADASDVVFAATAKRVAVSNSQGFSVSVLDYAAWESGQPGALPVVIATIDLVGIPYAVTLLPGTDIALVSATLGSTTLTRIDLAAAAPSASDPLTLFGSSFSISSAVGPDGRFVFVPHPAEGVLSVLDLEHGHTHGVSWLSEVGPTYAVVAP